MFMFPVLPSVTSDIRYISNIKEAIALYNEVLAAGPDGGGKVYADALHDLLELYDAEG